MKNFILFVEPLKQFWVTQNSLKTIDPGEVVSYSEQNILKKIFIRGYNRGMLQLWAQVLALLLSSSVTLSRKNLSKFPFLDM